MARSTCSRHGIVICSGYAVWSSLYEVSAGVAEACCGLSLLRPKPMVSHWLRFALRSVPLIQLAWSFRLCCPAQLHPTSPSFIPSTTQVLNGIESFDGIRSLDPSI